MTLILGVVLILSLLILLFLGPEWIGKFGKKPRRFKRAVRTARTPRKALVTFGRRTSPLESGQNASHMAVRY